MKSVLPVFASIIAVSFGTFAFAAEEQGKAEGSFEYKKNGGFESSVTSEGTDESGVKTKSETTVDVDVDRKGNVNRNISSEMTTDPKGLLNKKKESSEVELKEKAGGGYEMESTNEVKDRAGTNITEEKKVDVTVDKKGNVKETVKTSKEVDPEGLGNSTTVTEETTKVNGRVVEKSREAD